MASDDNAKVSGAAAADVCTHCGQLLTAGESGNSETPPSKRRSSSTPPSTSSSSKKLRSQGPVPQSRKWDSRPEFPVWVLIHDGCGSQSWVPGVVFKVHEVGDNYEVTVKVKDELTCDWFIPRTINSNNQDPIPSKSINDYLRERNTELNDSTGAEMKRIKCMNYHAGNTIVEEEFPEQGVVGKTLLDSDPESLGSLRNLVRSIMVDESVKQVVKAATGQDLCTTEFALAYFIGQFCGIEISDSAAGDIDPMHLLDQVGSSSTKFECPISQVFLVSAMVARTKKVNGGHPLANLYDSRARLVLSDKEALKLRMEKLKSALAAIHASQFERPPTTGPANALLTHGINMMIDMRGSSDPLLEKLANAGICRPPRVLRYWIGKIAEAIKPLDARSPPPAGKSCVLGWTADNADYHLFQRCVSVVAVANILLGMEAMADTAYFNENYMGGLGKVDEVSPSDLAATSKDDKIAERVIVNQNLLALLHAAADRDMSYLNIGKSPSRRSQSPHVTSGSTVCFFYRSKRRTGLVLDHTRHDAQIQFRDESGQHTTKVIPLSNVSALDEDRQQTQAVDEPAPPINDSTKWNDAFAGARHKFDPSTTSLASVLTGLSSKNNETARQVVREVISQYGLDGFYQAVHVLVADQEFMPTILRDYFSRLGSDKPLPLIPVLAVGHALKGISVSMMQFYQCFFDPIMESIGIRIGSPEYNRYYKGKVIRDVNRLCANSVEMLAVAATKTYLLDVGKEERIAIHSYTTLLAPLDIINSYFELIEKGQLEERDRSAHTVTVMDPQMRPQLLLVTDSLKEVVLDFQKWAKARWGAGKRDEVGPSGFVRVSQTADAPQLDPDQTHLANEIESDPDYSRYCAMPYMDDGDTPGLLTRCKNAKIVGKSSRKDKETLAKKLFLYEKRGDKEAAINFGPSRKLQADTNMTAVVLYDLLFGVERYVIVAGQLLTRVRPPDPTPSCVGSRTISAWRSLF